jgi:DNA-binding transcriptional LysR family regulator
MDRIDAMSVLIAVVEAGSLSAASRRIGAPLATVSRKISELEAHLNTRLLIRSTRKLMLTDAGVAYVAAAKRILEDVSHAERAASGEYSTPRGDLVITAPIVFGRLHVLPVIDEFLANFPQINVRLLLSDRNVHLIDDHIDMGVRIGALPDSSMVATRVGDIRRVVCGSPTYFARYGAPKKPSELSALSCVTFDMLDSTTAWNFTVAGRKVEQSVPIRSRLSVNTAEAAVDAAIAGVGVTRVLSYQIAHAVERGELQVVLAGFESEPLPVSLVHAGQGLLPLKTRSFLEFAARRLREHLRRQSSETLRAEA